MKIEEWEEEANRFAVRSLNLVDLLWVTTDNIGEIHKKPDQTHETKARVDEDYMLQDGVTRVWWDKLYRPTAKGDWREV